MKPKVNKRKPVLASLLLSLTMLSAVTVNASPAALSFALPVRQKFETSDTASEKPDLTGTYELTGKGGNAPMPESSENGSYAFTISGADQKIEIPLRYDHVGTYQYQLYQTTKDAEYYTYDRTVYTITVYVKTAEDGTLITEVIAEDGSGKKSAEILFANTYHGENGSTDPIPPAPGQPDTEPPVVRPPVSGDDPDAPGTEEPKDRPKTGDAAGTMSWLAVGTGSLMLILLAGSRIKRNSLKNNLK